MVQRVPVRIALDPKELDDHPLRVGLSMDAEVDVSKTDGKVLADGTRDQRRHRRPTSSASSTQRADAEVQQIIAANLGRGGDAPTRRRERRRAAQVAGAPPPRLGARAAAATEVARLPALPPMATGARAAARRPQPLPPLDGAGSCSGTIALSLATFMNVLDTSIANVSLPAIAGDLGVSPPRAPGSSPASRSPTRSRCR